MADLTVAQSLTLPAEPASVRTARRFVTSALEDLGLDDLVDAAALAVSELVTNALLHAHTPVELVVHAEAAAVRVEVCDGSALLPVVRGYGGYATTGRGLGLVASLVTDLGVEPRGTAGKAVWFTLRQPAGAGSGVDPGPGLPGADSAWDDLDLDLDLEQFDLDRERLEPPSGTVGTAAVLEGLPVTLWLAAQQHHDAALRELVLHWAEHPPSGSDVRSSFEAADTAHTALGGHVDVAVARALRAGAPLLGLPPGHPATLPRVPAVVTVEVPLETSLGAGLAALQDVLDEAERLAAAGALLIRPALPEVVAVRDWCCEQVIAQANAIPPAPWVGHEEEVSARAQRTRAAVPHPSWDQTMVRDSARSVVAADDNNRLVAVSAPAAAMLGWDAADLTGRRVVTLIPHRLREAHVAGFTRHLTTGEANVLGVDLVLPVLHADGHEITCRFLVERAPADAGRAVYLAWLTPV